MKKENTQCYYPAKDKKSSLWILLLHGMGGNVYQLKRHIGFLNSAGFSVYAYPAFGHTPSYWPAQPVEGSTRFQDRLPGWWDLVPVIMEQSRKKDILTTWTEELNQHLESMPQGLKVIFSFSLPSVSALCALSHRKDIKAFICDGGPFLNFPACVYRLFSHYYQIPSLWLKLYLSAKMTWAFRHLLGGHIIKKIQLPKDFPILSLQGAKDQQVHPADINLFFQKIKTTQPEVCVLQKSGHLKGLKTEPDIYTQTVLKFLQKIDLT